MNGELENIAAAIKNANTVALISHENPDGDTLGSTLALSAALKQIGKEVTCFCQDPPTKVLSFLPGSDEYESNLDGRSFDLSIAIDCASEEKIGKCCNVLRAGNVTGVIDHHGTNPRYAMINAVDADAPATTLLIYRLLKLLPVEITPDIALCLYTGTSTDTGHFAYSSTNGEAFAMMAELMEKDLPLAEIHRQLYRNRRITQVKLLGKMLSSLEFFHDGKYTISKFTQKDMAETGALSEDTEGLVNFGLEIERVKITAMLKEKENGIVRVSLRSFEPYHVDKAAESLGGGGHGCAAGCTLLCSLDQAEKQIKTVIENEIHRVEQ